MRDLWPIERAILKAAMHEYEAAAGALREQMASAEVTKFENTGAGFFTKLTISPDASRIAEPSPLDVGTGSVANLRHGMGFLLFLQDGHASLIEGYAYDDSTIGVDFETVAFDVKPWSLAGE